MGVKLLWPLCVVLFLVGCGQQGVVQKTSLADLPEHHALASDVETNDDIGVGHSSPALKLAALINEYRMGQSIRPLHWEIKLYQTALDQAHTMIADTSCLPQRVVPCATPDDFQRVAKAQGFDGFVDRNVYVALQPLDVQTAFDRWMNSTPHKSVLSNRRFNAVGVAIVQVGKALIYVAVLGKEGQKKS